MFIYTKIIEKAQLDLYLSIFYLRVFRTLRQHFLSILIKQQNFNSI